MRIRRHYTDTEANRPAQVSQGGLYYANDSNKLYQYFNGGWNSLNAASLGLAQLAVPPAPAANGYKYFDTVLNKERTYINGSWTDNLSSASVGGGLTYSAGSLGLGGNLTADTYFGTASGVYSKHFCINSKVAGDPYNWNSFDFFNGSLSIFNTGGTVSANVPAINVQYDQLAAANYQLGIRSAVYNGAHSNGYAGSFIYKNSTSSGIAGSGQDAYALKAYASLDGDGHSTRVFGVFSSAVNTTADNSNVPFAFYSDQGRNYFNDGLETSQSSANGSGLWKLGKAIVAGGQSLNAGAYVEVSIDGTVYKLAILN